MDLVYECFVKLGLRYVCVTKDGRYAGLVSLLSPFSIQKLKLTTLQTHKKTFVKYMRELEEKEGRM
jgi:chloride channel 3/4/5